MRRLMKQECGLMQILAAALGDLMISMEAKMAVGADYIASVCPWDAIGTTYRKNLFLLPLFFFFCFSFLCYFFFFLFFSFFFFL